MFRTKRLITPDPRTESASGTLAPHRYHLERFFTTLSSKSHFNSSVICQCTTECTLSMRHIYTKFKNAFSKYSSCGFRARYGIVFCDKQDSNRISTWGATLYSRLFRGGFACLDMMMHYSARQNEVKHGNRPLAQH